MKIYPTQYELLFDDNQTLVAKFNMFDDESFEVEIKTILSSDDLRELADALDRVMEINKEGV